MCAIKVLTKTKKTQQNKKTQQKSLCKDNGFGTQKQKHKLC